MLRTIPMSQSQDMTELGFKSDLNISDVSGPITVTLWVCLKVG
jgi:hypothetical protein